MRHLLAISRVDVAHAKCMQQVLVSHYLLELADCVGFVKLVVYIGVTTSNLLKPSFDLDMQHLREINLGCASD
jgi:hypothetical protein